MGEETVSAPGTERTITLRHRRALRHLAGRVGEAAQLPIMAERRQEWKRHNGLRPGRPMILIFPEGAWRELLREAALRLPVARPAHLARPGDSEAPGGAADEAGIGDGVVRRAKRAGGDQGGIRGQEAGDGMDLGHRQRFFEGEGREDADSGARAMSERGAGPRASPGSRSPEPVSTSRTELLLP